MTILIAFVLYVIFNSFEFFFNSHKCVQPAGVDPPSFQVQLISFNLGALHLFLQQETKKKGQHDCIEKEKTPL